MAISNYDYSKQIANLKNAQQKAATADLQATRSQALSNLAAEQQQNTANYAAQRSTANAQNRLAARNFQEYLANTGRANSGLGAQANMQYNNNLNTSLNSIYGAENAANADILRRRTDAQNAYSTGLAKANADIQANYIQSLIDERNARFDRDMKLASQRLAEKEFKESIRQFNKNYDLQKRNFSSGSGGGRSGYGPYIRKQKEPIIGGITPPEEKDIKITGKSSQKDIDYQNKRNASVAKPGMTYSKYIKVKSNGKTGIAEERWYKTGNGTDYRLNGRIQNAKSTKKSSSKNKKSNTKKVNKPALVNAKNSKNNLLKK